jgi:hypothetical protein
MNETVFTDTTEQQDGRADLKNDSAIIVRNLVGL